MGPRAQSGLSAAHVRSVVGLAGNAWPGALQHGGSGAVRFHDPHPMPDDEAMLPEDIRLLDPGVTLPVENRATPGAIAMVVLVKIGKRFRLQVSGGFPPCLVELGIGRQVTADFRCRKRRMWFQDQIRRHRTLMRMFGSEVINDGDQWQQQQQAFHELSA